MNNILLKFNWRRSFFIALCLVITVFAQEQQEEHKNFTIGQRFGTFGMNHFIPGLGSIVIMDDWAGAGIQWALRGTTIALIISLILDDENFLRIKWHDSNNPNDSNHDLHDPNHDILKVMVAFYILSTDILFNITRSATYDNPKYVQQLLEKSGNKNFTIGQRFETFGMNIIPGLGSIVVMDDWAGAITQWVLVGSGIALIDSYGPVLIGLDILFNIYRSATYNNLKNLAFGKSDGFHLSVLPNRHGKIIPHLLFNMAF
jgi:hypothetical protein